MLFFRQNGKDENGCSRMDQNFGEADASEVGWIAPGRAGVDVSQARRARGRAVRAPQLGTELPVVRAEVHVRAETRRVDRRGPRPARPDVL